MRAQDIFALHYACGRQICKNTTLQSSTLIHVIGKDLSLWYKKHACEFLSIETQFLFPLIIDCNYQILNAFGILYPCLDTGQYGGMRSAMQLRAFLGEMGCISISNIFGIPKAHEAISPEGSPQNEHMEKGAGRLLDQLEWMATAMKNHREKVGTP